MNLEEKTFQIGCMLDGTGLYEITESYELSSPLVRDENHFHDRYQMRNI
jgi:hypothetical protein